MIERSGLKRVRFHDLRHSHASQLLKAGVHVKIVSERLGHASVAFTMDTYGHVLPGLQQEAASKIDEALRTADPKAEAGRRWAEGRGPKLTRRLQNVCKTTFSIVGKLAKPLKLGGPCRI